MIERTRESPVHRCEQGIEGPPFFLGRVNRAAEKSQSRLAEPLTQGQGVHDFQWKCGTKRCTRDVAVLVGEGIDKDEALRNQDFAIDELSPHFGTARHTHAIEKRAARAQIHFAGADGATLWSPPVLHVFGIGPHLEDEVAGGRRTRG
jgi:hypothetical protein